MSSKCVLVIDDEQHLCTIIQVCLENLASWAVLTANSGHEGLGRAEAEIPDAILLDVMMPDIDGLALFEQLQANPTTQAIPVIFLTAKVQPSDQARFSELGIAGVIAKPFDPLKLADQVAEILGWQS